jgi:DNA polymerase-1
MDNRPILICDGANIFVRAYAAFPHVSAHGYQLGGAVGFMYILGKLIRENQPCRVIIAWEGGGSTKRRSLYSEYKKHRKPEQLNRFYDDDIPDTDENRIMQLKALIGFLRCVPVCQIYTPDCEGDDVIAYASRGPYRNHVKLIVSSDKDLFQLIDDKTSIYAIHKKTYVNAENVFEQFRITPENFAMAKAICGDAGDNIPGVKGIGFKTVVKLFPRLGTQDVVSLQEVFDYCNVHKDESRALERVLSDAALVRLNWRLVHLDDTTLSPSQARKVDAFLSATDPKTNPLELMKRLIAVGVRKFDVPTYVETFSCVTGILTKDSPTQ